MFTSPRIKCVYFNYFSLNHTTSYSICIVFITGLSGVFNHVVAVYKNRISDHLRSLLSQADFLALCGQYSTVQYPPETVATKYSQSKEHHKAQSGVAYKLFTFIITPKIRSIFHEKYPALAYDNI